MVVLGVAFVIDELGCVRLLTENVLDVLKSTSARLNQRYLTVPKNMHGAKKIAQSTNISNNARDGVISKAY